MIDNVNNNISFKYGSNLWFLYSLDWLIIVTRCYITRILSKAAVVTRWLSGTRMDNRVRSLRFQKSFQLVLHERAKQFVPDLYRKNAGEHIFIGTKWSTSVVALRSKYLFPRTFSISFSQYFRNNRVTPAIYSKRMRNVPGFRNKYAI